MDSRTMITEDYCDFKIAKLLKEKGFDIPVWTCYENDDDNNEITFADKYNWNNSPMGEISAPTLQMAMKWLREVHNNSIEVRSQGLKATNIGWIVRIYNLVNQDEEFHLYPFHSYEEAVGAAIKYCLENLI